MQTLIQKWMMLLDGKWEIMKLLQNIGEKTLIPRAR